MHGRARGGDRLWATLEANRRESKGFPPLPFFPILL
jgi:hypothetical protein